jgi:hypothetical protein
MIGPDAVSRNLENFTPDYPEAKSKYDIEIVASDRFHSVRGKSVRRSLCNRAYIDSRNFDEKTGNIA